MEMQLENLEFAVKLAVIASGVFFLNALLTGVWKYLESAASDDGKAHPYVDLAHRASLMYSFASLLVATFAYLSQLPPWLEIAATSALLLFFALAIFNYMVEGRAKRTDNIMRHHNAAIARFMWALIIAEIGGFSVLLVGTLLALF